MTETINKLGEAPVVPYRSIFSAFSYAVDTRETVIDNILAGVESCELYAKRETSIGIHTITSMGIAQLGMRPVFKRSSTKVLCLPEKEMLLLVPFCGSYYLGLV